MEEKIKKTDFTNLPRFKDHSFTILALIPEWAHAYQVSEEAIIRQLAWAHGWIISNPKRAPKKDVIRFLFNWMRLAQKHGNLIPEPAKTSRAPDPESDMTFEEMQEIRRRNMAPQSRVGSPA